MPGITIRNIDDHVRIDFYTDLSEIPIISLQKNKFFFNGQEIEDKYQVYERFNEWVKTIKPK